MDEYTKLLLHGNGIDGTQIFIDETGKTVNYGGAGVTIDTSFYVFGNASIYFDEAYGWLYLDDSDDWDFSSIDGTIDFRIKFNSLVQFTTLIGQSNNDSDGNWEVYAYTDGRIGIGLSGISEIVSSVGEITTGVAYHIAIVKNGSTVTIYKNGNNIASGTATVFNTSSNILSIGADIDWEQGLDGWIDELRISKGIARWTSNFTPPTEEYTDTNSIDGNGTIIISGESDVIAPIKVVGNGQIIISGESEYYNIERTLLELTMNTDIRFGEQELLELTMNTDIRFSKIAELTMNTDIRFSNNTYTESYLRGVDDFDIKLDSVTLTDVDIEASSISYKLGISSSEARLVLVRRHDNLDYTLAGVYSQITNENKIEIYDDIRKIFTGYITKIDCNSETDTITVTAQDARYKLARTSQLQLNRGYFDKEKRDQLIDDGKTIYYTNQTALQYVLNQAVSNGYITGYDSNILADLNVSLEGQEITDTYVNCIDNLLKEVLTADWYVDEYERVKFIKKGQEIIHNINLACLDKQRTIYDAILSDVSLDKEHSFYLSAININYGKQINNKYWIYTSYDLPSETFYWTTKKDIAKTYFSFQTYQSATRYIGEQATNYGYRTATQAVVLPWWILQINTKNNEEDITETVLGSGEVKKTLNYSQYGIKVADSYYEEKTLDDGSAWLYKIKPKNYNFTNYVNDIAKFEYYQNNKLLTTANVSIFLDTFLFYNIKIGSRINLDNTINAGIYKNNNEFPLTIESIDLSFKDRTMRLSLTNFGGNYYKRTVSYNSGIINEDTETKLYKKITPIVAGQGLD